MELIITSVTLFTVTAPPAIGEKVPLFTYNGAGTVEGTFYLADGTPSNFSMTLTRADLPPELSGLYRTLGEAVLSKMKGGGMNG